MLRLAAGQVRYNVGMQRSDSESLIVNHLLRPALALAAGLMMLAAVRQPVAAAGPQAESERAGISGAVCPPRLMLQQPQRCMRQGARAEQLTYAEEGLAPTHPLPLARLDPSLGQLPFSYIQSRNDNGTPLYTSLDDALKGQNAYRTVEPGFVYFSWIARDEGNNSVAYMIVPGVYVRGDGMSRLAAPSFRGLAFNRTPQPFGWILTHDETRTAPGNDQPTTGRTVERFQVVYVFDRQEVGGRAWYRIGPEDWVEDHTLAVLTPDATRPEDVEADRWISINLYEQTLAVYESGRLIFATLVSTGLDGWWTQPGTFQVYEKLEADPMSGSFTADRSDYYYLEDVPWILYFDKSRALHGAYWHNGYGYPRSHGCVNLSPADAHWLYDWADVGTWVYVYDPSGRTPTDAELYGEGGA
jgi:hypothetical protein